MKLWMMLEAQTSWAIDLPEMASGRQNNELGGEAVVFDHVYFEYPLSKLLERLRVAFRLVLSRYSVEAV